MNTEDTNFKGKDLQEQVKITQTLEKALLEKDVEMEELRKRAEYATKIRQTNTKSVILVIALVAPILLMAFLVLYSGGDNGIILAAVSFVSLLTGSITVPLIMNYFGIDKEIQSQVIQKDNSLK